ncbi:EAL domain-containing protein [Sulfurospirillum oryzae]|uniref:EAL domain-containing protein n=1 Tax=Sulfurospirillum oryzae TaxID=2976535 RepID=UPI0021E93622|nr:GGDEF and EAL domain-containing protein [Sulfurospirillum oryzae]
MRKELKYELRYGRIHPLTKLPDRQRFMNTLANSTANKLALLNVNGFWNFNHSFGYTVGDQILKIISQRLIRRFAHAVVFHLGGDDFAILAGKEVAHEHFLQNIESCLWYFGYSPIEIANEKIYTPLRIGVAIGYDDLFLNAEFAIKQAKRIGKDLMIYDAQTPSLCNPQSNAKADLTWENIIREALKKDRFEVFAQSIEGGKIQKFECLVRLRHEGRMISPYLFLNHAKRANLYGAITKVVIQKSFAFFADKNAEFSINLSLSDILDQSRVDFLLEKMYEYNVNERLTIEVTEGEGIENHPEVLSFLSLLKSQGVKIAIDDFGTGYSNFEYLVKLQADFIKIDGSLIKNIHKNAIHRAVVEAIVTFAQKVGMQTVAEFVANEEIYLTCKALEIDYFQGYLWSEPTPFESLVLH